MRKTCKIDFKNEPKTHQKSSKNKPKKHTEKMTRQFQPKWTKRWPKHDRQGREREGSRMVSSYKKKKNIAKREHAGHLPSPTRSAAGKARPGGESRLPAAIVPPPGLGKIVCMRKFARNLIPGSMQECFFTNFCLKNWISPKTSPKETPEGAK